ncbi:hypothetical protein DU508_22350 [Pedobacter chinensis]|uniref:Uncharacterized protein n=1 Tax=Pedobacter chinensis TaxID=2282421 RepID=A0A369PNR0_9SPHI|nr:DUF6266 family protein [Pedobacter chinensis]RDC54233.1 hypothetical protein DU508_22350 [Pedobacter chinensis]
MAILNDGVNGGFTGKVGSVIGYQLNGKWVIKGLPKSSKKNKKGTADQNKCRSKFTLMQHFLAATLGFVRVGFHLEAKAKRMSAHNAAKSYNMLHAFNQNNQIDYSKIRLSHGNLLGAEEPQVLAEEHGLRFTWNKQQLSNHQSAYDQVMLLAFNEESNMTYYMLSGAKRKTETEMLEINEHEKGKTFHTWISFIADDRENISNSVYAGSIIY